MPKIILITDDEKHMVKMLEFSLMKTGCRVETAASGEEALARAMSLKIDLLLIDVEMPGINGFETVRAIRQQKAYGKLPVIMLTGCGQDTCNAATARRAGASLFLIKPFSPKRLLRVVEEILAL
jgi:two-component system chemotaxis response regulator CheY